MKQLKTTITALIFAGTLCAPNGFAQDEDKETPELPRLEDQNPMAGNDSQQEILELFKQVERRLILIDRLLLDASAGDTSALQEVRESGMDDLFQGAPENQSASGDSQSLSDLLNASQAQGEQIMSGIDRIIEIAAENGSAAGACSKPDPNKPSPVDNRGEQRTKQNETPEAPQQKPGEQGEQPQNPKPTDENGANKPANTVPQDETQSAGSPPQDKDHWGDLPIHVREIFRAEGGRQMPSQYRDWVDAYYRRLNSRSGD